MSFLPVVFLPKTRVGRVIKKDGDCIKIGLINVGKLGSSPPRTTVDSKNRHASSIIVSAQTGDVLKARSSSCAVHMYVTGTQFVCRQT